MRGKNETQSGELVQCLRADCVPPHTPLVPLPSAQMCAFDSDLPKEKYWGGGSQETVQQGITLPCTRLSQVHSLALHRVLKFRGVIPKGGELPQNRNKPNQRRVRAGVIAQAQRVGHLPCL